MTQFVKTINSLTYELSEYLNEEQKNYIKRILEDNEQIMKKFIP